MRVYSAGWTDKQSHMQMSVELASSAHVLWEHVRNMTCLEHPWTSSWNLPGTISDCARHFKVQLLRSQQVHLFKAYTEKPQPSSNKSASWTAEGRPMHHDLISQIQVRVNQFRVFPWVHVSLLPKVSSIFKSCKRERERER